MGIATELVYSRRPHCKPEKSLDLCIPVDINLYVLGISSSILRPECYTR